MAKVTVEVCSCCAITEPHIKDSVARIRAEHGSDVTIVERKCLDVCKEFGAVKVEGEVILVREEDVPTLEDRIRQAARHSG